MLKNGMSFLIELIFNLCFCNTLETLNEFIKIEKTLESARFFPRTISQSSVTVLLNI